MLRICLSLLLAVASASLMAREVKLSSPGGAHCDEQASTRKPGSKSAASPAPPARETKAKPGVHSDAGPATRLPSPRWHSFLPGMFR